MTSEPPVLYFGCVDRAGHYVWLPGGQRWAERGTPWKDFLTYTDGKWAPPESQREFVAHVHHLFTGQITLLSYWDRTVDQRQQSSSTFLALGELTYDEMAALAEESFPDVWSRAAGQIRLTEEPANG